MYIGFSTAYGHRMIGWADARLAYHFSGGPKPVRLSGWAHAKSCWADVARTALAAVITAGILLLLACWPAGLLAWWAVGFRVRPGKNLSYGKTGLRVNGKVGGVRISAGKSGTYLGAGVGPLRYNTRLKTSRRRGRSQAPIAGPGARVPAAPRPRVYIHSLPR